MVRHLKLALTILLITIILIFVIQNTEVLNVDFLAWSVQIRRVFLIFFVLVSGIIVGWVLRGGR